MAGLLPPFDYSTILIGEEIVFRALSQQQRYAKANKYGMSWSPQDDVEKGQAFYQANVLRTDFAIPPKYQQCIPEPPCPWDKHNDELTAKDLMPILMSLDGVYSYTYRVSQNSISGNTYQVGQTIAQYGLDQGKLDPTVQTEFAYYEHQSQISYLGDAILLIEKLHRGQVQSTFTYLFKLV